MNSHKAIGQEVKRISNMIMQKFSEQSGLPRNKDLTSIQGWIIGYIFNESKKRDVFQKDIEKEFKIRRSTATGMLNLLEKNGYVCRVSVPQDARLKKLVLTEEAIKMHKKLEQFITVFDAKLEEGITSEEKETFYLVLDKITKNLENEELK